MLKFLKENSYGIFKMFLIQIGMTVFGLMLAMATVSSKSLLLAGGIFAILFYMYLLYSMVWEAGAKDKIRIEHRNAEPQPWKGFAMSLVANIPNILLAVLIVISFYNIPKFASGEITPTQLSSGVMAAESVSAIQNDSDTAADGEADTDKTPDPEVQSEANSRAYEEFIAGTPEWALNLYQISSAIFGFLNGMYTGIIVIISPDNPLIKLAAALPAVLVSGFGYLIGTTGKNIFPQLRAKKPEKTEKAWGNNLKD
ncbi:MAG TPA: hypothetical protein GX704_06610 [Clostridiales bacterium]|jgi:hypothetical protein|nr:hypothetical protein [Clostridiales bacterium]